MFVDTDMHADASTPNGPATDNPRETGTRGRKAPKARAKRKPVRRAPTAAPKVRPWRRAAVGALEARLGGRLDVAPHAFGPVTLSRPQLVDQPVRVDAGVACFRIEGPWRDARMAVDLDLLHALIAPVNGGALPGPDATALLLELVLEAALSAVEEETGPLRLAPSKPSASRVRKHRKAVRLDVTSSDGAASSDETAGTVTLWGCDAFEARLAETLAARATLPPPPAPVGLLLPARMRAARMRLTAREAEDLRAGDVILADGPAAAGTALAMLGGRPVPDAAMQVVCAGFVIDLRIDATPDAEIAATAKARGTGLFGGGRVVSWKKEHGMSNLPASDLPAIGVGSVEVVLDVEFAREGLTLDELTALQPGSILTFAQSADAPLTVRINGRPFALCEAVSVGDRSGVRIVSLLASPDAAQAGPAGAEPRDAASDRAGAEG